MRTWAPVLKTIATSAVGLPLIALVTWLAASRLYLGLSTGQISPRFSGLLDTGYARLISFENDPVQFTAALLLSALLVGFGLYVFAKAAQKVWLWFTGHT
ncbi:hypothetical protein CKO39_08660 [Rhodopseudomonas palustris]|nr:hypothetical protein CKO39_08660 [Rhodopseudomonas palustris]